jgi:hypothetical protein
MTKLRSCQRTTEQGMEITGLWLGCSFYHSFDHRAEILLKVRDYFVFECERHGAIVPRHIFMVQSPDFAPSVTFILAAFCYPNSLAP